MNNSQDWNPGAYTRFRDLRLRPAMDLLAQVPPLPEGPVIDLGCGYGAVGAALKQRFERRLVGVDNSASMLAEAAKTGVYDELVERDIANWGYVSPALIFSNAALHWLPNHETFFPRLASLLPDGGVLAVQMPRQFAAPSHALLRQTAQALFPDRFDYSGYSPPVAPPQKLAELLEPIGTLNIWETRYFQKLESAQGHPVRRFTGSTAARPILAKLDPLERERFLVAYDEALLEPYPLAVDGSCVFPFLRQFIVLTVGV